MPSLIRVLEPLSRPPSPPPNIPCCSQSDGKALVWGAPPQAIRAQYRTGDGRTKTSLLLVSGWWGLARHFHYLPELVAAAIWSMPAFHFAIMPFVYLAFLTILLLDRAYRWGGAHGSAWRCSLPLSGWEDVLPQHSLSSASMFWSRGQCSHRAPASTSCCIDPTALAHHFHSVKPADFYPTNTP